MRLLLLLILLLATQALAQTVTICRVTLRGSGVSRSHMTQLIRKVEKISGLKLTQAADLELPADLYEPTRQQYDGGALAALVAQRHPGPVVGLAEVDLYLKSKD